MKKNYFLQKATILTITLLLGVSYASMAATFTATTTGNWSSATTWGGTGPSFNITGVDNVIIPLGVTVTLDANLTIDNAAASLSVGGASVSYTHLRAHETDSYLVCRL